MNLPNKFKFKSTVKGMTVKGMDEIIYTAIKVENSYFITWNFFGSQYMTMKADDMQFHFDQNEYEFTW